MKFRLRFYVDHASRQLSYRLEGMPAGNLNSTAHCRQFDEIGDLKAALKTAGLPARIAEDRTGRQVYEVTGKRLRALGFNIDDSAL